MVVVLVDGDYVNGVGGVMIMVVIMVVIAVVVVVVETGESEGV